MEGVEHRSIYAVARTYVFSVRHMHIFDWMVRSSRSELIRRYYYGVQSTKDNIAVKTFQTQWFTEGYIFNRHADTKAFDAIACCYHVAYTTYPSFSISTSESRRFSPRGNRIDWLGDSLYSSNRERAPDAKTSSIILWLSRCDSLVLRSFNSSCEDHVPTYLQRLVVGGYIRFP